LPDLPVLAELPPTYEVESTLRGVCALHASLAAPLRALGYGPDLDLPLSEADVAGRRRLFELEIGAERFLVRRFAHGGLLRWLTGARFLDAERPFREIVLSERLRAAGLPTPLIAAARARRRGGAGWSLEVVTRRVEGSLDLGRVLAGEAGPLGPAGATRILAGAGRLVREMHEAGFFHADLTPRNLLVERAAAAGEPGEIGEIGEIGRAPRYWILDLDRSEFRVPLGLAERLRNLRRLYRHVARLSSEGHLDLSRGDYLRFLTGYEPRRDVRKDLWRRIRRDHDRRRAVHAPGWALERRFRGGSP
jgi:hypothetical protein